MATHDILSMEAVLGLDQASTAWEVRRRAFWNEQDGTGQLYPASNVPDVIRMMVESALARMDYETAEMYLRDWRAGGSKPTTRISKYVPGTHYYVLDTKFETLDSARSYARVHGYNVYPTVLEVNIADVIRERRERGGK